MVISHVGVHPMEDEIPHKGYFGVRVDDPDRVGIAIATRAKIIDLKAQTTKGDGLAILDQDSGIGPGTNPFVPIDRPPLSMLGLFRSLHQLLDGSQSHNRNLFSLD